MTRSDGRHVATGVRRILNNAAHRDASLARKLDTANTGID